MLLGSGGGGSVVSWVVMKGIEVGGWRNRGDLVRREEMKRGEEMKEKTSWQAFVEGMRVTSYPPYESNFQFQGNRECTSFLVHGNLLTGTLSPVNIPSLTIASPVNTKASQGNKLKCGSEIS